jgi:DNA-directed RNA polymerase specialized sigma24 family protein
MPPSEDVSHWIGRLKSGDPVAAQKLWENYYQRLVALARNKLHGLRRSVADEEDVALSAFASFCKGAERERFPQLTDRTDLWKLLVVITARKACDLRAREKRLKRGGGKVAGESALPGSTGSPAEPNGIQEVIDREPTPEFALQLAEEYQLLLNVLDDADLRTVAVKKVEGFSNEEIAAHIGRSLATVERKLNLIRRIWEKEKAAVPPET